MYYDHCAYSNYNDKSMNIPNNYNYRNNNANDNSNNNHNNSNQNNEHSETHLVHEISNNVNNSLITAGSNAFNESSPGEKIIS